MNDRLMGGKLKEERMRRDNGPRPKEERWTEHEKGEDRERNKLRVGWRNYGGERRMKRKTREKWRETC